MPQTECNGFRDRGLQLDAEMAAMRVAENDTQLRMEDLRAECERLRAGARAEEMAGARRLEEQRGDLEEAQRRREAAEARAAELEAAAVELHAAAGKVGPSVAPAPQNPQPRKGNGCHFRPCASPGPSPIAP